MDYFEVGVPKSDGLCSDKECPCSDTVIPCGSGYLYITHELVNYREQYPREGDAQKAVQAYLEQNFPGVPVFAPVPIPVLMCEMGARRRNLDLEAAAEDAKHWWETGLAPLRATPTIAKSR